MRFILLYPIVFLVIYTCIKPYFHANIDPFVYLAVFLFYAKINRIYGLISVVVLFAIYLSQIYSESAAIPKHIYQTWNTKELPPQMKACVEKLKRENPEFEHHLYDDADCREFIRRNYEKEVLEAYERLIPGAYKADLWRYCMLYKKGGVYLDIKFQCAKGVKLSDLTSSTCFIREYNGEGTGLCKRAMYTGCIITVPENPIFLKCIRRICMNVKNRYYGNSFTEPTGPILFGSYFSDLEKNGCSYAYHEKDNIGYIRHIEKGVDVLSFYSEYREEQKRNSKTGYWKTLWKERNIYAD